MKQDSVACELVPLTHSGTQTDKHARRQRNTWTLPSVLSHCFAVDDNCRSVLCICLDLNGNIPIVFCAIFLIFLVLLYMFSVQNVRFSRVQNEAQYICPSPGVHEKPLPWTYPQHQTLNVGKIYPYGWPNRRRWTHGLAIVLFCLTWTNMSSGLSFLRMVFCDCDGGHFFAQFGKK